MGFLSGQNDFKAQLPGQKQEHVTTPWQGATDDMNREIDAQNAATGPGATQMDLASQVAAAQAANPYNVQQYNAPATSNANEQALAQALMNQANGTGPNPALAAQQQALQSATNRNVAQNAGMMASQKGINAGTQNRLIAQNAAATGQQMAGQGAQMQGELLGQQQATARGQLGQLYMGQRQQDLAERQQNMAQNAQYNELMNQQRGMQNQYIGTLLGANQGQNALNVQQSLGVQGINAGVASQNQAASNQVLGGVLGAAGAIGGAAMGAQATTDAAKIRAGYPGYSHGAVIDGEAEHAGDDERNDTVPAMLSPGEIVVPRSKATDPDKAMEFIESIMGKKSKGKSYGHVLEAKRKLAKIKGEKS